MFIAPGIMYKQFIHAEEYVHPIIIQAINFEKKRYTTYISIGGQYGIKNIAYEWQIGAGISAKQYYQNNNAVKKIPRVHDTKNIFFFESTSGVEGYFFLTHRFGYHFKNK